MSPSLVNVDDTNCYLDTRGQTVSPLPFSKAIIQGLADGGGLFVPQKLPDLTIDDIVGLAELPYARQAAKVYSWFGVDFTDSQIETLMQVSYGDNFASPDIAPVVEAAPYTYMLELTHGPTAAFKDLALQCLPNFFSAALEKAPDFTAADAPLSDIPLHLMLVATSGDTGSAALAGFKDRDHTGVIVYYPQDGVSATQKHQMTAADGNNLGVFAVAGNFDDCQTAVKAVFNDSAFAALLAKRNVYLSSANSINWGRLLPQIVYYVSAYAKLVAQGALQAGQKIDVCVPTGNFGNILAAWYAREIGTPIEQLYCASNENHVLTDFINTGTYDISNRSFSITPSPSMDILVSSNLERQLYELNGHNPESIRQWMSDLNNQRSFRVDEGTFAALRKDFRADWIDNEDSLATIREVWAAHQYLLDPHTAVAWKVAERLRPTPETPVLVVSTAHWAKFADDVYRALNGLTASAALPPEVAGLSSSELIGLIQKQCPSALIPRPLAELDGRKIRFKETVTGTLESLEQSIIAWLTRLSID